MPSGPYIDLSNPAEPKLVGDLPAEFQEFGPGPGCHRQGPRGRAGRARARARGGRGGGAPRTPTRGRTRSHPLRAPGLGLILY